MLDNKLTQDMQSWLETEPAQRDIMKGALMVLQLNRNKHMYSMAQKAPHRMADKIEYELRKYLRIRLDGLTSEEVARMEEDVVPRSYHTDGKMTARLEPDETTGVARGLRPDHDQLPENIRALWDKNRELYQKLRYVHETLRSLEDAQPCDRYEQLKILKGLDILIRKNMAEYDGYKLLPKPAESVSSVVAPENPAPEDPAVLSRKIQAARTYISENKSKIAELTAAENLEAAQALADKVMERVAFLQSVGCPPSQDTLDELDRLMDLFGK